MRIFRKIKYRLRRFLISLLFGIILCSTFIFPASAEVNSLLLPNSTFVAFQGISGILYSTNFFPGDTFTSPVSTTSGSPISLQFRLSVPSFLEQETNPYQFNSGVVGFDITFLSDQYLTSDTPDVKLEYIDSDRWNQDIVVPSSEVNFSLTSTRQSGSGTNTIFLCELHLSFPTNVLKHHSFHTISFKIERSSSTHSAPWTITSKTFSANVYTGNDVPLYPKPDTSAKDNLDATEGQLNDAFSSFNDGTSDIFNLSGLTTLFSSVRWWSENVFGYFMILPYIDFLLILSLAVGIFSLLFGLFGSIISRNNRAKRSSKSGKKSGKNKGG